MQESKTTISHAEALKIAQRFIDDHFRNPVATKDMVRVSIPANPERDDDLRLIAYIKQQEAKDAKN